MADIGLPSGYRTPGVMSRILFGTGESLSGGGVRKLILIDTKLTSGLWADGSYQPGVKRESDVIAGAGAGSEIHRAWLAAVRANKNCTIDILVVAPTTGSATSAVTTITIAGTATGPGFVSLDIAEERSVTVTFVKDDTAATIATNFRAKISGMTHLPVTVSGSAGAVTLTAVTPGARAGVSDPSLASVRIASNTPGNGITLTGVGNLGSTTAGTEGSTTEAAQVATALANLPALERYYVIYGDAHNATAVASIRSWIAASAVAKNSRRMVFVTGSRRAKSSVTAVAITANYEREVIAHQAGSYWSPAMLAAQLAATCQLYQDSDATHGFVDHSGPDWLVPEAPVASQPNGDDISDLISDGVSTIASKETGGSYLPMLVNTRSKDSSGAYDDFRACEMHRVSGADYVVRDLEVALSVFKGQKLGTRPKDRNGVPDYNFTFPKGTFDEYVLKSTVIKRLSLHDGKHLQRIDETLAGLTCARSSTNAGAIVITFTQYAIDICSQLLDDVSEGSRA